MSVAAAVRELVQEELAVAAEYAAAANVALDASGLTDSNPAFFATFSNRKGETFTAEIRCDDYPQLPPTIEFVDSARSRRGSKDLYPACFHGTPCVCARYNRKAYSCHGGPHSDWRMMQDWRSLPTSGGVVIRSLGEILSDLHGKIADSEGRLG